STATRSARPMIEAAASAPATATKAPAPKVREARVGLLRRGGTRIGDDAGRVAGHEALAALALVVDDASATGRERGVAHRRGAPHRLLWRSAPGRAHLARTKRRKVEIHEAAVTVVRTANGASLRV